MWDSNWWVYSNLSEWLLLREWWGSRSSLPCQHANFVVSPQTILHHTQSYSSELQSQCSAQEAFRLQSSVRARVSDPSGRRAWNRRFQGFFSLTNMGEMFSSIAIFSSANILVLVYGSQTICMLNYFKFWISLNDFVRGCFSKLKSYANITSSVDDLVVDDLNSNGHIKIIQVNPFVFVIH